MNNCQCMTPPFSHTDFDSESIGTDETKGRYGDVSVETCKACGSKWVRYYVAYEGFTASGRWYRGLVIDDMLSSLTPENAVELLESLPWHFAGGSYFDSTGFRSEGAVRVDL